MCSLLNTPSNGSESLIGHVWLWFEGNVGSQLCKLNSRRARLPAECWITTAETDYAQFEEAANRKQSNRDTV